MLRAVSRGPRRIEKVHGHPRPSAPARQPPPPPPPPVASSSTLRVHPAYSAVETDPPTATTVTGSPLRNLATRRIILSPSPSRATARCVSRGGTSGAQHGCILRLRQPPFVVRALITGDREQHSASRSERRSDFLVARASSARGSSARCHRRLSPAASGATIAAMGWPIDCCHMASA